MHPGVEVVLLVAQDAPVSTREERFGCPGPRRIGSDNSSLAVGLHCCWRLLQFQRRLIPVLSGGEGGTPRTMRPSGSRGQWFGCWGIVCSEAGFGGSCSGSRHVGNIGSAHQPLDSPGNRSMKTSCAGPRRAVSIGPRRVLDRVAERSQRGGSWTVWDDFRSSLSHP